MNKFNGEEIVRVVETLNGSIQPVGETNTDNQRFDNLKDLETVIDCLLDDIQLLIPNRNSYEYSVERAGVEAVAYLQRIEQSITDWLKEYEVEE